MHELFEAALESTKADGIEGITEFAHDVQIGATAVTPESGSVIEPNRTAQASARGTRCAAPSSSTYPISKF